MKRWLEVIGCGKLLLTGWARPPRYDKEMKVLNWAKALDSGEPVQVLIYGVRVLGKPVLQMVSSDFEGRKEDRAALRRG